MSGMSGMSGMSERGLSFFARRVFTIDDQTGARGTFLCRVSSRVRGEEIAAALGARYNPSAGYEGDRQVWVKPRRVGPIPDGAWVDVLDEFGLAAQLKARPGLKVISMSQAHDAHLHSELPGHEVRLIPHHHLNFERLLRPSGREVRVCGFVGSNTAEHLAWGAQVARALERVGLEYRGCHNYLKRQDSLDFYRSVDLLVIAYFGWQDTPYRHPTKIVNAASFGIPTVAGPIQGYREVEGHYLRAGSLEELVAQAAALRDPGWYRHWAEPLPELAEQYHISRIANLYRALD